MNCASTFRKSSFKKFLKKTIALWTLFFGISIPITHAQETHYPQNFDCRPLMLFEGIGSLAKWNTPLKAFSFLALTPVGGLILFVYMIKNTKGQENYMYWFQNNVRKNIELFHLVNFLYLKAGQKVIEPNAYLSKKPLPIYTPTAGITKTQIRTHDFYLEYDQVLTSYGDQLGKKIAEEFYLDFKKLFVLSNDEIHKYLYLAALKLNTTAGDDAFCKIKPVQDQLVALWGWFDLLKYGVVSFDHAKKMILTEALAIAKKDQDNGHGDPLKSKASIQTLPVAAGNPFDIGWQRWVEYYGKAYGIERYK